MMEIDSKKVVELNELLGELRECRAELELREKVLEYFCFLVVNNKPLENYHPNSFFDDKMAAMRELKRYESSYFTNGMLVYLGERGFTIDLCLPSIEKDVKTIGQRILQIDPLNVEAVEVENIGDSIRFMGYALKTVLGESKLNFADLSMATNNDNAYKKLVSIILSREISVDKKKDIMRVVTENYPLQLHSVFSVVPSVYYSLLCGGLNNPEYVELLKSNLQSVFDVQKDIFPNLRKVMTSKHSQSYDQERGVTGFIKFFVDYELVDINSLGWYRDVPEQEVSNAVVAYSSGHIELGDYLYALPSQKTMDPAVRTYSDKMLVEYFSFEGANFIKFISHPNYEATPDKLRHLMIKVLEWQAQHPLKATPDFVEKIIGIFLKKTKKEHYKEMLKAMEEFRMNVDADKLEKSRSDVTGILKVACDSALNQVPALKRIEELEFTSTGTELEVSVKKIGNHPQS